MSNIQTFDSSTKLRICEEGYNMTKQEYYSKKRCTFSCCDCFHKKCAYRVWHILLFLFIIIVIIGALVVIIAMFGPVRSPDMKYSKRIGSDTPEGGCKGNCTRWVYQEPAFCVIVHNCHQGGEWSKCTPLLFLRRPEPISYKKKKCKIESWGLIQKPGFEGYNPFKMWLPACTTSVIH